jgi:hypothetical protein
MFDINEPLLRGADWFVEKPALEKSLEWQWGMFAFMTFLAVLTVIYALRLCKKYKNATPIWIVVGSAIATFYEPLGDFLSHVTYHEVNTISFTSAFGFTIPLWVFPCYVVFFGAPILALIEKAEKNISINKWMLAFVISIPGAALFEFPILAVQATEYYGNNQPWKILNYPIWMAFSNTCTMFVTVAAVYFSLRTLVVKQNPWLLAILVPLFIIGSSAASIMPVGSALSATDSAIIVNIFAVGSMVVSVLLTWISGRMLIDSLTLPLPSSMRASPILTSPSA